MKRYIIALCYSTQLLTYYELKDHKENKKDIYIIRKKRQGMVNSGKIA